jgi:hypothetical protein
LYFYNTPIAPALKNYSTGFLSTNTALRFWVQVALAESEAKRPLRNRLRSKRPNF